MYLNKNKIKPTQTKAVHLCFLHFQTLFLLPDIIFVKKNQLTIEDDLKLLLSDFFVDGDVHIVNCNGFAVERNL